MIARPTTVGGSPSWSGFIGTRRWAILYSIVKNRIRTDTLIVFDRLLRDKVFAGDLKKYLSR